MGYCTDRHGRLCCDICGNAGEVRRVRCPYGYCPATAACPKCRKEHKRIFSAAHHREHGCKARHEECVRREAERVALLKEGRLLRCAAVKDGPGVKVWFESSKGRDHLRWMSAETYRAFDLLENVTLEQFDAVGAVVESPELLEVLS